MATRLEGPERSVVLEVDGLQWATEKNVVEGVLGRRPGVTGVEANPVNQTATVTFDPARTAIGDLAGWVRDCGYHCQGESVPDHVCPPAGPVTGAPRAGRPAGQTGHAAHQGHDMPMQGGPGPDRMGSPAKVMGHGGHGEISIAAMATPGSSR